MQLLNRFPIIVLFIAIAIMTSMAISFYTYQKVFPEQVSAVKAAELRRVHQRMLELQGTVNDFNRRHDFDAMLREVSRLSADPTLDVIAIIDEHQVVHHSNLLEYRNVPLAEIPDLEKLVSGHNNLNDSVVLESGGKTFIVGLYRLDIFTDLNGSERFPYGLLVSRFDLSGLLQELRYRQQQDVAQITFIYLGLSSLGFLLLYLGMRRQIDVIVEGTDHFANGDFNARIGLHGKSEFGQISQAFDAMADKLQKQTGALIDLAEKDALTKLKNRGSFYREIEARIEQRSNDPFALVFIDLDRFKIVNDSLGHQFGDQLLKMIAQRILNHLKENDLVARFGGDEFVIALDKQFDTRVLTTIVQRLLGHIAEPLILQGHSLYTTASIGIARYPTDGNTVDELIQKADIAMYQVKGSGKNALHFFQSDSDGTEKNQLKAQNHIKQVIQNGEIYPAFQAQVDIGEKRVVGYEALARIKDERGQWISPDYFIPLVEENGWMSEFSRIMYRNAMQLFVKWVDEVKPALVPTLSLNVCTSQFNDKKFVENLDQLIRECGFNPHWLEMEITESVFMGSIDAKLEIFNELKAKGIQLSLDDFGTGYSSLSYLKKLPLDKIKIDQSFVRDIDVDADDNAIIETIIAMGSKLGLKVVAEGVETMEQLQFLERNKCQLIQGYLVGKPGDLPKSESELLFSFVPAIQPLKTSQVTSIHKHKQPKGGDSL